MLLSLALMPMIAIAQVEHTEGTVTYVFDSGPIRYGRADSKAPTQREGVVLKMLEPNLTTVNIPYNVSRGVNNFYIEIIGSGAFSNCKLESITLCQSIKHIESDAFYYCPLKKFVCPAKLRSIGRQAFAWCTELEEFTTDMNLKSIGASAFRGCSKLKRFDCPPDMHTIGDMAFMSCTSLEIVTLGRDMMNIGEMAFEAVPNLRLIVCENKRPHPAPNAFSRDVLRNTYLVVPDGCVQAYRATIGWKDFAHIIERSNLQ